MSSKKTTKQTAQVAKNEKTLSATEGLSIQSVTTKLAGVQVEVQKKLAEVGTLLQGELQTLEDLNKAVLLKKEELRDYYALEEGAIALDELKQKYEAEVKAFEALKEENLKKRAREEEDYRYKLSVSRRDEEDSFKKALAAKQTAFDAQVAEANKLLNAREEKLKVAESELATIRKSVTDFPSVLEKEVAKAKAAVQAELTQRQSYEIGNLRKEMETAQAVYAAKIASATNENDKLHKEVERLREEIKRVQQDAKDVAVKALEAGNRQPSIMTVPQFQSETSTRSGR